MKEPEINPKELMDRTSFQNIQTGSKFTDALANLTNLVVLAGVLMLPGVVLKVWIWAWPF